MSRFLSISVFLFATHSIAGQELSTDQKLIVACFKLDVATVVSTLRNGASVDATFGKGDVRTNFPDDWTGCYYAGANQWTPLQALANSNKHPESPRKFVNEQSYRDWADQQLKAVPQSEIDARNSRRIQILNILLSHGCNVDAHDDRGATALYWAITNQYEDMANLLLDHSPNVNTKTGLYIDGTFNDTPLHRAYWSPKLINRLIEMGANQNAKDSEGRTPEEWRSFMNTKQ